LLPSFYEFATMLRSHVFFPCVCCYYTLFVFVFLSFLLTVRTGPTRSSVLPYPFPHGRCLCSEHCARTVFHALAVFLASVLSHVHFFVCCCALFISRAHRCVVRSCAFAVFLAICVFSRSLFVFFALFHAGNSVFRTVALLFTAFSPL
jgi:hypothetical protein